MDGWGTGGGGIKGGGPDVHHSYIQAFIMLIKANYQKLFKC